jgi:hypothetical protein
VPDLRARAAAIELLLREWLGRPLLRSRLFYVCRRLPRRSSQAGARDARIIHLPSPEAVRGFRDRLAADGVMIVEEWDEPEYVSVKCLDPDGYIVEAAWEPHYR